jgi:hypothetical protein
MPTGRKAFVLRFKQGGKDRLITLGQYPVWTLAAAREEARERRRSLDRGIDPDEAKREQRQAEKEAQRREALARERSLTHLMDAYTRHLIARGKTDSARLVASVTKRHIASVPEIATKPAAVIRPEDIVTLVRRVYDTGKHQQARNVRSFICSAFNLAWRAPLDPTIPSAFGDFGVTTNPATPVRAIPGSRGQRILTDAELRAYLREISKDAPSDIALRLALLAGGQRLRQLLRVTGRDWDPQARTLRLWDGKGARTEPREHLVPLATEGAALVARMGAIDPDAPLLQATVIGASKRCAYTARKIAPRDPFDLRDIRRSVETRLASLGISRDTRAQLLSHGLGGIQQKHYDRHQYLDEKRAALVAWEAHLAELREGG